MILKVSSDYKSLILPLLEGGSRSQCWIDVSDSEYSMRKQVVGTAVKASYEGLLDARYQAGHFTCVLSLTPQATLQYGHSYLCFADEQVEVQKC